MIAFAKRLKRARREAGFASGAAMADALGIDCHRYRHWERGATMPDVHMLARITHLLRVDVADLLPFAYRDRTGGDGEPRAT